MADRPDLPALLSQYRAGLEAEIAVLHKLERTATRQHDASTTHDMAELNRAADERDALMAGLVSIEGELSGVRSTLAQSREQVRHMFGYHEAVALHKEAIALVTRILTTDGASLDSLAAAEMARRYAARAVEQGETTLAAYRRVMTMPPGATLVDRRG